MDDLQEGMLATIKDRVLADHTLCIEIREDYVNIYYRGGSLLRLTRKSYGYEALFDTNYGKSQADSLAKEIRTKKDAMTWVNAFASIKQAMDLGGLKEERVAQQLVVKDNNFGSVSKATDFFICDIEYECDSGRFDFVAVHWPSTGAARKKQDDRRLVLGEIKYGDNALTGDSGILDHVDEINEFLGAPGNLQSLKEEMVGVFKQKHELGLIDCKKPLSAFSDEPPMLMLYLVNHDPQKGNLGKALRNAPPSPHAEIFLSSGCFMGYGLFDPAIIPLQEIDSRCKGLIKWPT